jgi:uncharacterized protein YegJ (DUF2314 family)
MTAIIVRRILGSISLTFGLGLMGWFGYNLVHPTPEFQNHFRSIFQLLVPIAFITFGWRWIRYQGPGIEEVTRPDFHCRELEESLEQAKKSIAYFLQEVAKNVDGAFIKFPMKTANGSTEHIWAYVHSYCDGIFNVSLANQPRDARELERSRRDVPAGAVEDWQIMYPDGRIKGAYSLIALFRHRENQQQTLSPKMRKQKAQLIDAAS